MFASTLVFKDCEAKRPRAVCRDLGLPRPLFIGQHQAHRRDIAHAERTSPDYFQERKQDGADRLIEHVLRLDVAQFVAHQVEKLFVRQRLHDRGAECDIGPLDAARPGVRKRVAGEIKLRHRHIEHRARLAHDVVQRVVLVRPAPDRHAHVVAVEPAIQAELVELVNDLGQKRDLLQLVESPFIRIGDKGVGGDTVKVLTLGHDRSVYDHFCRPVARDRAISRRLPHRKRPRASARERSFGTY